MIQPVRYQKGCLYQSHGSWFVRFRFAVRKANGSVEVRRTAERLGSVDDFATKADVEVARQALMQRVNDFQMNPHPSMTLSEFVEQCYLPWVKSELSASTYKGCRDIWNLYLSERVGQISLRRFRTVDASRMLRTIAEGCNLTKTTLQHIKSVLSGIFTHAKNEGAYDGENPVEGARILRNAREPGETYAYNLVQILRILEVLPLLPKAAVATASFAGLREGELRGVEWQDFSGDAITVSRSIWKTVVNEPKTRASRQSVPVIPTLAKILEEYRASMQSPRTGVIFHSGNGVPMDMDKLAQRVIRPAVEASGMAGMASGGGSHRTCTNWTQTRRSSSASCVMRSRMSPGSSTSRPSIQR